MTDDADGCARCGGRLIPVFYGMPIMTRELEIALAAGDVVLGGCDPSAGPAEVCASCSMLWPCP